MLYETSCEVFGDSRDVDGCVSYLVELNSSALTSISFGTYYDDHIDCVRIFIIINIPQTQISSSENIIMCYLFTESNYVDFHRI